MAAGETGSRTATGCAQVSAMEASGRRGGWGGSHVFPPIRHPAGSLAGTRAPIAQSRVPRAGRVGPGEERGAAGQDGAHTEDVALAPTDSGWGRARLVKGRGTGWLRPHTPQERDPGFRPRRQRPGGPPVGSVSVHAGRAGGRPGSSPQAPAPGRALGPGGRRSPRPCPVHPGLKGKLPGCGLPPLEVTVRPFVCVLMYVCTSMYMCVFVRMFICVDSHVCMCIYACAPRVLMYICAHVCTFMCKYVHSCVCIHVRAHYACVCI